MPISSTEFFRYLPAGDRDKLWGLCVTGVGHIEVMPGDPYPPGVHPDEYQFHWPQKRSLLEYQLQYITVGDGVFESASAGRHRIGGGNVVITFPNEWHRYAPGADSAWTEYWVGFRGEFADHLVAGGFIAPETPILKTGHDEVIQHEFSEMLEQVRDEPPALHQLLAGSIMKILGIALAADRIGPEGGRHTDLIKQAKRLLNEKVEMAITMHEVAAQLNISEAQFRRVFRRYTGDSPYQYYLDLRINRAKELLSNSRLSIKEVSASLRFENQYHFSNAFKKKTGMAPTEWRQGGGAQ